MQYRTSIGLAITLILIPIILVGLGTQIFYGQRDPTREVPRFHPAWCSAPQYTQPSAQLQKPSLEDTLQMFMQNTMQFQQATQSSLQANSQAIAKLEMQMSQLATSLNERKKGKFPSQAVANPKGQLESGANSHHEQAKAITTLRSGKTVDNHVGNSEIVELQGEEDATPVFNDNISKSLEPPTNQSDRNKNKKKKMVDPRITCWRGSQRPAR